MQWATQGRSARNGKSPFVWYRIRTYLKCTKERNEINAVFKYQGLRHNHKSNPRRRVMTFYPVECTTNKTSLQSTRLEWLGNITKRNRPQELSNIPTTSSYFSLNFFRIFIFFIRINKSILGAQGDGWVKSTMTKPIIELRNSNWMRFFFFKFLSSASSDSGFIKG